MARLPSSSDITALRDDAVLRHVRQLGSAHSGQREWRLQRWTALALIPLGLWFVISLLRLAISDQTTAATWLASPVPALLVLLFVFAALAHAFGSDRPAALIEDAVAIGGAALLVALL